VARRGFGLALQIERRIGREGIGACVRLGESPATAEPVQDFLPPETRGTGREDRVEGREGPGAKVRNQAVSFGVEMNVHNYPGQLLRLLHQDPAEWSLEERASPAVVEVEGSGVGVQHVGHHAARSVAWRRILHGGLTEAEEQVEMRREQAVREEVSNREQAGLAQDKEVAAVVIGSEEIFTVVPTGAYVIHLARRERREVRHAAVPLSKAPTT
jgi:hypothetical protein